MTPTSTPPGPVLNAEDTMQRDALSERMFMSLLNGIEMLTIQMGIELGLYAALVNNGPCTSSQLSEKAGIHERYAREWLEQQAAANILVVDQPVDQTVTQEKNAAPADGKTRAYLLPAGHAEALLDPDSAGAMVAAPTALIGLAKVLPTVIKAYPSGEGVPFADYGQLIRHGIGNFNRPEFVHGTQKWIREFLPDVNTRLHAAPSAKVLDIACGTGWSSIGLARAFPEITIDSIDLDEASITDARRNAAAAGVLDRLSFSVQDATALEVSGPYDLICIFKALHDMAHPVETLRNARLLLQKGAPLLVVDEQVCDTFTAPADPVERFLYGWSVLHCLPATRAEGTEVEAGTILRSHTLLEYAEEAGFSKVDILPIEHDFWRFYRLNP